MPTPAQPLPRVQAIGGAPTANERFKETFRAKLALSMVLATTLHVLVLQAWPEMDVDVWARDVAATPVIPLPPDVAIPDAPEPLTKPVAPVVSTDPTLDETLPIVDWRDPVEPPPPPTEPDAQRGERTVFAPFTVAPRLLNPEEVQRTLQRTYPSALRDAGIGGTVRLLIAIDESGAVLGARIAESSRFEALDEAALRLAPLMRFSPALNRDRRVAVQVSIPVTFEIRQEIERASSGSLPSHGRARSS